MQDRTGGRTRLRGNCWFGAWGVLSGHGQGGFAIVETRTWQLRVYALCGTGWNGLDLMLAICVSRPTTEIEQSTRGRRGTVKPEPHAAKLSFMLWHLHEVLVGYNGPQFYTKRMDSFCRTRL